MYKLLVVDDEDIIREGIINLINNSDIGFEIAGQAADGEKALQLAQDTLPDAILTDIFMPRMDGIEFLEMVKSSNPDIRFIIISGYGEFEYAQKAISLGVTEYLLKPIDSDKLIHTLINIKEDLDRNRSFLCHMDELNNRIKDSMPVLKERLLRALVEENQRNQKTASKLSSFGIDIYGNHYSVALLQYKNQTSNDAIDTEIEVAVEYILDNILNSVSDQDLKCQYFFSNNNQFAVIISCLEKDTKKVFKQINILLNRLLVAIQKQLNIPVYISLGKLYEEIKHLPNSFMEAQEAMEFNFFKPVSTIVNYEDVLSYTVARYKRPVRQENDLILNIKLCDKDKAFQSVEVLFDYYKSLEQIDPNYLKSLVFETALLILRVIEEIGGQMNTNVYGKGSIPYKGVFGCESMEQLQNWFLEFVQWSIEIIHTLLQSRNLNIAEKAKEMIGLFISNEDFSLDDIAAKLFISPNYLRQIFKQNTGKSFVEYLTAERMKKASQLLNDPTLKLQDIAANVGYNDPKYFAMCFKKHFQCTTSEYRALLQSKN